MGGGERDGRARLYAWLSRRLYAELAWAYDAVSWLVSLGHWSAWRQAALDHLPEGRVLELGFGTGALLEEMARRGWRAVGVEPSAAMQRVAARRLRRAGLAVPRVRARAEALPFADGSYDALVCTFPASYILSPETLHEAARVLRPGGTFAVGGLYLVTDVAPLRLLAGPLYGVPDPEALERLRSRFAAAGFTVRVVEGVGLVRVPLFILERGAD